MERIVNATLFLTALGSGLMAGLFFIFSVCIMTALGRLTPASGIAAMQSINVVILNGIFLTVFMGTAVLCLALIAAWLLGWVPSGGLYVLAGSLLYLVGIIGVTMFVNVPMNDALMAVQPRQQRRCRTVEGLSRQLDDVEPCSHDRRNRQPGLVDAGFRGYEQHVRWPAAIRRGSRPFLGLPAETFLHDTP